MLLTQEQADETADCRAKAGADFLDANHHGWAEKIDLDTLSMAGCFNCVLGQLYGNCGDGFHALKKDLTKFKFETLWVFDLGFASEQGDHQMNYAALNRAWRVEITKRLEVTS